MRFPLLFFCVLFYTFSSVYGQQNASTIHTLDSLEVEKIYALAVKNSDRHPTEAKKYLYQLVNHIDSLVALRHSKNLFFNKRKADAYHFLSYYERRENNYDEAALLAQKSIDIKIANELDSLLATSYHQKAKAWLAVLNSIDEGVKQLKVAEKVAEKYQQKNQLLEIYSSFGSAYGAIKDTLNAMTYYNKSLHLVDSIGTDYQKATIYANYASILRRFGDYQGGMPYVQKAIKLHKKGNNQIGLESGLYALGIHYTKIGQPEKAIPYLKQAIEICNTLKSEAVLPFRYLALSKAYDGLENYKESHRAYLTYSKLLKKRNDIKEVKKMTVLEESFKYEKEKALDSLHFVSEKRELEIQNNAESAKKNLYLLLFTITVIAGVIITFLIRRMYKNKIKASQVKLEEKKEELHLFMNRLIIKSKEQEQFKKELDVLKQEVGEKVSMRSLQELASSKILTQEDWYTFKQKFTSVYPLFFPNISKKGYKLTKSEERLVALEKLNLDSGEIANLLGISFDSVVTNRYRLRKKINAPKEIPIVDYFESDFLHKE
ncbi:tetratricopeptide repeat protein [Dokdonia sp.]|uniref:tetratricopeptide repeat protein n=1 Tax=Dokdonia sp. TaxID=2024995 RepID=UPI0032640351